MSKLLQVLIIEDSEADAALIFRELRRGDYDSSFERVNTVGAMAAALDRQEWDLVLADCDASKFSGPAALALLRDRQLDLPLILVPGTIGKDTALAALKAGATDCVLRHDLGRLVLAVERALRETSERRARKQSELALRASERRFRSLTENASGIIAVLGLDGRFVYANPSTERILGYSPDELTGTTLTAYAHPDDAPLLDQCLGHAMGQHGVLRPVEFRIQHRDRSWRLLGAMIRNLLEDPELQGIVINAQDITERRQLEEQFLQAQKMEAVGRLAGGVAHDFNSMIGAITGYADLLLGRVAPGDAFHSALQEIMKAADRAAILTRQLLLFSRKEAFRPQVLDVSETLTDTHKMLRRLIGEDIEMVALLNAIGSRVKADPGHIQQVLMNLVINARDAMPDGGTLTLQTRIADPAEVSGRHPQPDGAPLSYVLLEVSDDGCGMDEATQARIFEPFFTTKERGKGTGLGLTTVYSIVEQIGAQIQVESRLGTGTIVRIYPPQTDEELEAEPAAEILTAPSWGSETILLAEDEPIMQRAVREGLEASGYTVLEAMQGDEALRLCQQYAGPIDLLLTDVVMPGMNGRKLAERARALRPKTKVLFMSGYTDEAMLRHGSLDAETAFIQKPFKPAALEGKVRELLGIRSA